MGNCSHESWQAKGGSREQEEIFYCKDRKEALCSAESHAHTQVQSPCPREGNQPHQMGLCCKSSQLAWGALSYCLQWSTLGMGVPVFRASLCPAAVGHGRCAEHEHCQRNWVPASFPFRGSGCKGEETLIARTS